MLIEINAVIGIECSIKKRIHTQLTSAYDASGYKPTSKRVCWDSLPNAKRWGKYAHTVSNWPFVWTAVGIDAEIHYPVSSRPPIVVPEVSIAVGRIYRNNNW